MPRTPFAPGNSGGPGRGNSRNRLQTKFLHELAEDFEKNGAGVIRICRLEQPVRYLQIIASVLPRELVLEQNVLSDMSDDDIAAHLLILQKLSKHKEPEEPVQADEGSTKH